MTPDVVMAERRCRQGGLRSIAFVQQNLLAARSRAPVEDFVMTS